MNRLPKWFLVVLALALMVGLAGVTLAADETTKGTIKRVSADKKEFVMTDKDNKDWTFHLDDNAKLRLADKDVKLDDLKAGDMVEITYAKQGDRLVAKEVRAQRK